MSIHSLNGINFSGMYYKDSANFIMVYLFPDGSIPLPSVITMVIYYLPSASCGQLSTMGGWTPLTRGNAKCLVIYHKYHGDDCCEVIL